MRYLLLSFVSLGIDKSPHSRFTMVMVILISSFVCTRAARYHGYWMDAFNELKCKGPVIAEVCVVERYSNG